MKASGTSIVILTGAGISAESGLATFRDKDGLWEGYRVEEVASPEGFLRNPALVHEFYNLRRAALKTVMPNAAHLALARLQNEYHGHVTLITQNVDDLHELAGSTGVIHMHGELRKALCTDCARRMEWEEDLSETTVCPVCGRAGFMRPDIVWFGEIPYHMEAIHEALAAVDLFVAIGTSGLVYPAAGLVALARRAGARTIEINNAKTAVSGDFDRQATGSATVEVVRWVDRLFVSGGKG